MKVKKAIFIFLISGVFWGVITFFILYTFNPGDIPMNQKSSFIDKGLKKSSQYSDEQIQFIKDFQSSFNDR
ncbi:hypothetical protein [Silvanigrella aquatica]|uniref:Uncharacterized protein n=1 Tax=Silvanigrella aquatica TaxID=1915309 RepID=A0A1L4CXF9_9BACT|nr:hypothetical protein [Silvanigrella aquatica]APJ02629.1 hypothetical protein AXG55_01250 [Silvanigrella aquatica]